MDSTVRVVESSFVVPSEPTPRKGLWLSSLDQDFSISKDQVTSLKRLCGGVSTFCAVSALVWRCVCVARKLPPDAKALLTFLANIRSRVTPPLPERYFGNALVRVGVTVAVRDIIASEALVSIAGRIGGVVRRMDDEMVRSSIDYIDTVEMDGQWAGTRSETELQVTSWLGMPMYDANFGRGKPLVVSRADSNRGGSVHLMSDGLADGVRVLICMEAANVKERARAAALRSSRQMHASGLMRKLMVQYSCGFAVLEDWE